MCLGRFILLLYYQQLLLLAVTLCDSGATAPTLDSLRKQGGSEGHMCLGSERSLHKHGGDSYLTGNNLY